MDFFNKEKLKGLAIHLLIMFLLTFFGLIYFFSFYLPNETNHGESITVPNLYGLHKDDLGEILGKNSLNFVVIDSSTYNPKVKPNTVINQTPKAGSKVKENRKIYISLNASKAPNVKMPQLVNKSLREALIELQHAGLKKDTVIYKPHIFKDVVIEQHLRNNKIAEGRDIPRGTKIKLIVGLGSDESETLVPNLVGKNYRFAKEYLGSRGLIMSAQWNKNSKEPEKIIYKQSPTPSDSLSENPNKIKVGSIIDVWISGEEPKDTL